MKRRQALLAVGGAALTGLAGFEVGFGIHHEPKEEASMLRFQG